MKAERLLSMAVLVFAIAGVSTLAEAKNIDDIKRPKAKGLAIAEAYGAHHAGWGDSRTSVTMINGASGGDEQELRFVENLIEVPGEGIRLFMSFTRPRSKRGTEFLTSRATGKVKQWLYFPELQKVKAIDARNVSGSYMGSQLAYEDLRGFEITDFEFKYLQDEACGAGYECWVVEVVPEYKNSGYTRQVAWIDKAEFRLVKIESFDRNSRPLKTAEYGEYNNHEGFWRAARTEIVNHQSGKSTTLLSGTPAFGVGLKPEHFERARLGAEE